MPTYEYRCEACGHEFERFQNINDAPVRTCPECGEKKVQRLISQGGGLVFKGPGFYATDYRSPPPGQRSEKKKKDGGASGGSEGG